MRRADGSLASDIDSICSSWVDFYSALFTAEEIDSSIQADLLSNLSARLPSDARAHCEGLLSPNKVLTALKGMAHNKSLGSNGLPMEFYLTFWETLGSDLVEVLNSSFEIGSLPSSQKGALISLIFKKGDQLQHKNRRPISLLNVDYKLCARALAGCLLGVLLHVISSDQTCGVRGCFIGENVALLRDIVHFASETGTPAAIELKAFDRVDWPFLLSILVLALLLFHGLNSFIPVFGVLSLSMVTLPISSIRLVEYARGAPSPPCVMSFRLRFWQPTFVLSLPFWV